MMVNSCIYEGKIRHRRFEPVGNEFCYRQFMMYVDLDELSAVFRRHWLWSAKGPNLAWFRRDDYFDPETKSLADAVRGLVETKFGVRPSGPIRLLTHFRYFGFAINPISLYYCFGHRGDVEFVIAEVTNTPWGEKHCYAFDARKTKNAKLTFNARKELHVSPFMQMDYDYSFRLNEPGKNLIVHVENHRLPQNTDPSENFCQVAEGSKAAVSSPTFDATLTMQRRELSSANLAKVLFRYPLMTVQVFVLIHWQAFRLWAKKLPFQKHPKKLTGQAT